MFGFGEKVLHSIVAGGSMYVIRRAVLVAKTGINATYVRKDLIHAPR
jgi:hypothetical protein